MMLLSDKNLENRKSHDYLSNVISKSRLATTNPKPTPIPINTPFTAVKIIEEKYPKSSPILPKPCTNKKTTSMIKVIITERSIKDIIALNISFFFSILHRLSYQISRILTFLRSSIIKMGSWACCDLNASRWLPKPQGYQATPQAQRNCTLQMKKG